MQVPGERRLIQLLYSLSSLLQPSTQSIRREYVSNNGLATVVLLQQRGGERPEVVARRACFEPSVILLPMNESFQHSVLPLGHWAEGPNAAPDYVEPLRGSIYEPIVEISDRHTGQLHIIRRSTYCGIMIALSAI